MCDEIDDINVTFPSDYRYYDDFNVEDALTTSDLMNLYYSYRCGISLPFTHFEMRVLDTLQVASTQLHPNAWATLHTFQGIC
ncbi:hypothetical protein L6164_023532 [Bauhinia variegata]|uniref:Uncharacterized protein n=1 Tax=Bauhinia variegata TaxID=167791 RepID=A0ACB9MIU1_BAUVA|nr:hypothetical protein L6164_023532 [Bauhinia variegata]